MLTQKLVLSYSTKILLQLIQMATSLIVARLVGPSVLGTIAFGSAYVSMFLIITDLGFGTAHIKMISEGRDEAKCNGTYATIKLSLIGVFIIVFLSVFFIQKFGFHKKFETATHEKVIFIYLIIIVITQTFYVYSATWAAKTEQAKQDIPAFIQTLLYQILRIILAILGFKAIGLVLGNLAAVLITVPIYLYLGRDLVYGRFDKTLFKDYFRIAYPTIAYNVCVTLIYYTDKVILQSYTNSVELGYYSAAFVLGTFIKTIESSAGMLLFPYFSKYIAEKNYANINFSIRKYERFTFTFILPMAFIVAIFSDMVIHLTYGSRFVGAVPIFSILIISFICSLTYLPYGNILFGMGLYKLIAKTWTFNLLFFWLCSFFLVSGSMLNLKGTGMSLALLLTNLLMFGQMMFLTKKYNPEVKILPAKKVMFFALIFFSVIYVMIHSFSISSIWLKILLSVLLYFLFLFTGYLMKILQKEDYDMFLELINLNKMKTYITQEILKRKK